MSDSGGGGGSGFVWKSGASVLGSYTVPARYQMSETKTVAGNATMPTTSGTSTMTGNSGNGYAKITIVSVTE